MLSFGLIYIYYLIRLLVVFDFISCASTFSPFQWESEVRDPVTEWASCNWVFFFLLEVLVFFT